MPLWLNDSEDFEKACSQISCLRQTLKPKRPTAENQAGPVYNLRFIAGYSGVFKSDKTPQPGTLSHKEAGSPGQLASPGSRKEMVTQPTCRFIVGV
jgi:hypothetical protein